MSCGGPIKVAAGERSEPAASAIPAASSIRSLGVRPSEYTELPIRPVPHAPVPRQPLSRRLTHGVNGPPCENGPQYRASTLEVLVDARRHVAPRYDDSIGFTNRVAEE